jgi:TetR/AcrR family transcriptional repressor of nem operon
MPARIQFDPDLALHRAMEHFWANGYEKSSMDELVHAMGIRRSSLYATFGDKRALFLAALRRYDHRHRSARLDELRATHAPLDAIVALFSGWSETTRRADDSRGCLLANTATEFGQRDEDVTGIVRASQDDLLRFFEDCIRAGQADGSVDAVLAPREIAGNLLLQLIGMLVLIRARGTHDLPQTTARRIRRELTGEH